MENASDYNLDDMVASWAVEIFEQTKTRDEGMDLVYLYADGSEWVIWYSKAHDLCRHCNTEQGEDFVNECYPDSNLNYNEMASAIAYGEIQARLGQAVEGLYEMQSELLN
jgi:hypothetical protein